MDEGQQAVSNGRPLSPCSPLHLLFLPTLDPGQPPYAIDFSRSLGFEFALALDELVIR